MTVIVFSFSFSLKLFWFRIAKNAVNIHVFQSRTDANGKPIGENGSYSLRDGSIHIDLNAGNLGQGVMAYTIAHEFTHFMEQQSPAKFQAFTDALFAELDVDVEAEIEDKAEKLKRQQPEQYRNASRETLLQDARSEVVAEACETMLTDTDAAQRIGKTLQAKDATLFEKVKQWFRDLAAKLRRAYNGLNPDSQIAQYAKKTIQQVDGLVQLWADMAVDAAENYRGAVAKDAGITSDDSMYSIRRTSNMSWGQQIRSALKHNGKIQHMDTLVVMSNTPAYLLTGNTVNLPMAIPLSVITKAQKGQNADHAISDKNLIALQYGMENAIAVIDNPGRNSLAFITSLDEDGGKVAVFFDKNVQFDGDQVNKATSIHRRTNIVGLMNNLSDDATIYVKNKNEFDAIVGMADSIPAAYKGKIKFVYDRISHEENSVKLFSDRYSENMAEEIQQMEDDLSEISMKVSDAEQSYNALLNDPDLIAAERRMSEIKENGESLLSAIRSPEYRAARADRDAIKKRLNIDAVRDSLYDLTVQEKEARRKIDTAKEELKAEEARKKEVEAIEKSGMTEADYFRSLAADKFGYTDDFLLAGYLLPDGKMLDFSSEEGKRFRQRDIDHRAVSDIYEYTQGTAALNRFLKDGNVRIMAGTPGIDVSSVSEPTSEQYAVIKRFVRDVSQKRRFDVDISAEDGRNVGTYNYDGRVNADMVVNDLKYYYQTGELRKHSDVSRFLYSNRDSQSRQSALEKQNGKLREDVERLRELLKLQGKTTGGKLFKPESIKTAANFIMRETGRSLDADGKAEFAGLLTKAYTALSDENVTYDDIIRECTNVAQWLDENGETQDALDEYAGGILSEMKGIPIRLPNKNAAITNRDKCLERNGSIFCLLGSRILHIKYAHNHNTSKGYGNAGVVLPAQLFFQEDAAPQHGNHAVGGNDRRCQGSFAAGQGVDVSQLSGGLKAGADVLGGFQLWQQLLLLDNYGVDKGGDTSNQEGQFIGDVGGILIQGFQHQVIGKGSGGVQKAVSNGQGQGQPGFGVLIIRGFLPGGAERFVLMGFHKAQADHTGAGQEHSHILDGNHFLGGAGDDGDDRHKSAGGVADRGGNGKLDVAKAYIAQGHGTDVQQGNGKIGPDHAPGNFYAADKDFKGGMQAHDHANGGDHFELAVLVEGIPAADFGEEVRTGPAKQGDNGKPEPTHETKTSLFLLRYSIYSPRSARPASTIFCRLMRMPSFAWNQVRPPWK